MSQKSDSAWGAIWESPAAATFVVFAVLFGLLHFGASLISEGRLLAGGEVVSGKVYRGGYTDDSSLEEGVWCYAEVRFSANGMIYKVQSNDTDCFEPGESALVVYLPHDPEVNAIKDWSFGRNYELRVGFFLLCLAVFGHFLFIGITRYLLAGKSSERDRRSVRILQLFIVAIIPASFYFGLNDLRLLGFGADGWGIVFILSVIGFFVERKIFGPADTD